MTRRTNCLPDDLYAYLSEHSVRESDVARRLREGTRELEQSGPEQGPFMALLVELLGVENALEVGMFTGYSALAVASVLPEHGRLVACDVREEWTAIGRRYWAEAGVAHKIDLRLAPAIETRDALLAEEGGNGFDFAFIDADEQGYEAYFERALRLVRPGGLIAVDPLMTDPDTEAIRRFNERLSSDSRISLSLVPIGDGLSLARVLTGLQLPKRDAIAAVGYIVSPPKRRFTRSILMSSPAFLQGILGQERRLFCNVVGAVPEDGRQHRADPKARSAEELIGHLIGHNQDLIELLDDGVIHHRNQVEFGTIYEAVATLDETFGTVIDLLGQVDEETWMSPAKFYAGDHMVAEGPRMQLAWMMLLDAIHHRGQLSTYLRPMGSKVPAIYGPSADDEGPGH